ncbi:hypothetical protein Pyn_18045 [Prunus yedoensis var. nudiflora]|uniref:Uncharacterized protein n=1 Tax=Prunus yedoensis var. nudiflora TaxID=2094558 RepID=A0A314UYH9_PRUYE|nr:hypothetical protein Pyn_18045 [Prunus yedoensis var. nudiflora]
MANHPRGANADDDLGPEDQTSLSLGSPSNASVADVRGDCSPCITITTATTSRYGRMKIEMLIMSLLD